MSDALNAPAPSDESTAASVEDPALGENGEVEGGSASSPGEELIPASRFNGLMGAYNKFKSQAEARQSELEEQLSALQAEVESLRSPQQHSEETPEPMSEATTNVEQQVALLTQMLMEERLNNARQRVLAEHPEIQPFADLIVADTVEEFEEMAQLLADRIKGVPSGAPEATPPAAPAAGEAPAPVTGEQTPAAPVAVPAAPAAPAAPVVGGGTTFDSSASVQDRVSTAIQAGDWSGYLRAKQEAAEQAATGSSALVS